MGQISGKFGSQVELFFVHYIEIIVGKNVIFKFYSVVC